MCEVIIRFVVQLFLLRVLVLFVLSFYSLFLIIFVNSQILNAFIFSLSLLLKASQIVLSLFEYCTKSDLIIKWKLPYDILKIVLIIYVDLINNLLLFLTENSNPVNYSNLGTLSTLFIKFFNFVLLFK